MLLPGRLFRMALLKALPIKEVTVTAFPRKFLVANLHVLGQRSFQSMHVFIKKQGIHSVQKHHGQCHITGNARPTIHFFLVIVTVRLGRQQFFLILDPGPDLFNGLRLHFRVRAQFGYDNRRAVLQERNRRTAAGGQGGGDSERLESDVEKEVILGVRKDE